MRLIGPNCLGILNTDPEVGLNATFAPGAPPAGNVGFVTAERRARAGGDRARRRSEPRHLLVRLDRQSRRRHRQRPPRVLGGGRGAPRWRCSTSSRSAIRAGSRASRGGSGRASRSSWSRAAAPRAGARATTSHTGALLAASDVTVDALFEQAGVIRADSLAELLDVASLLANQPLPAGRRVGDPHQRGRPRDHVRRRLRGRRPRGPRPARRGPGRAARVPPARGLDSATPST